MTVTQAWKEAEQGTGEQWDELTRSLDISLESLDKTGEEGKGRRNHS